ncbi:hypothetical protein HDU87_004587 [Geranomyces variabilis]|uniref:BCAS3 domain-containing protein n=1 Tax=Geranomyces variabilis TaxID=109894 RepID=A0AAD5TI70_9FUNG|nr:hypothetical protein HDU87_004587 [Geranomyces variabilis]
MHAHHSQGVRAQPKALRPPTFAAEVSSYLGGLSSYISHNLPDRLQWNATGEEGGPGDFEPTEKILSAKFCWINWATTCTTSSSNNNSTTSSYSSSPSSSSLKRLCLFLGYQNGFHIWDVTDADNVYELASLRTGFGNVHAIEPAPAPLLPKAHDNTAAVLVDTFKALRPLVALITDEPPPAEGATKRSLKLFSMHSLNTAYTLQPTQNQHPADEAVAVKCNSRVIAVAFASHVLNIYSSATMALLGTFTNVIASPARGPGVWDIGMRYIIYATSTAPPLPRRASFTAGDVDSDDYDEAGGGVRGGGNSTTAAGAASGGGGDDHIDARKVAGKVAKELVVGAKVLGEYGYHTLSNYFAPAAPAGGAEGGGAGAVTAAACKGDSQPRGSAHHHHHHHSDTRGSTPPIAGAVIIAALPLEGGTPTPPNTTPIAHWKPHTNPVSVACFDLSQTLGLTASMQGTTFYLWEVPTRSTKLKNAPRTSVRCLYKLERGYTAATIESIAFSHNSRWIGATTARGTTHVYHVDPFVGRNKRSAAGGVGADERLALINGLTEPAGGGVSDALGAFGSGVEAVGGVKSVYPVARVKRQLPSCGETPHVADDLGGEAVAGRSILLAAAFLPAEKLRGRDGGAVSCVGNGGAVGYARRPSGERSSPGGSLAGSWGSPRTALLDPLTASAGGGGTTATTTTTRVHRQRILTFQSSERGGLMIHHVDVMLEHSAGLSPTAAGAGTAISASSAPHMSFSAPRSGSPLERFSPSSLLWNAVPAALSTALGGVGGAAGMRKQSNAQPQQHVRVKVSDLMEWNVKRDADWGEVKQAFGDRAGGTKAKPKSKPKPAASKASASALPAAARKTSPVSSSPPSTTSSISSYPAGVSTLWAKQIEIRTHHPSLQRPPVFLSPQFVFQVYDPTATSATQKKSVKTPSPTDPTSASASAPRPAPDLDDLPPTRDVQIKREALKPHGADERRSGPSSHFPTMHRNSADGDGEDGIQENLSTAMDSPIMMGQQQRLAKVVELRPPKKVPESLSFEDAFHIPIDTPPASWSGGIGTNQNDPVAGTSKNNEAKSSTFAQGDPPGRQQDTSSSSSSSLKIPAPPRSLLLSPPSPSSLSASTCSSLSFDEVDVGGADLPPPPIPKPKPKPKPNPPPPPAAAANGKKRGKK